MNADNEPAHCNAIKSEYTDTPAMLLTTDSPMTSPRWMIYGAYGYTGRLIVGEAVRRGWRPILAGRSHTKLRRLADDLGLEGHVVDLDDHTRLMDALEGVDLVLNAAGPFIYTGQPMIDAALATGTSYLDISGELSVFRSTLDRDREAAEGGIALISGCGFDVVPTDCLALHLAGLLPGAVSLELAIDAVTAPSAGTIRSALELAPDGGWIRRDGVMKRIPIGEGMRRERFAHGKERTILPLPLGDLESAYWSTGIPNITTYLAVSPAITWILRFAGPLVRQLLNVRLMRRIAQTVAGQLMHGPDEVERRSVRSYIRGRLTDADGNTIEGSVETVEAYRFTAVVAVRIAEKVLEQRPAGAFTPASAFGTGLLMEIDGSSIEAGEIQKAALPHS